MKDQKIINTVQKNLSSGSTDPREAAEALDYAQKLMLALMGKG